MIQDREYSFVIDRRQPSELPMERLAQYMGHYAKLLGEPTEVHFACVEPGSTRMVAYAEGRAEPKIQRRLLAVCAGDGPKEAMGAYEQLERMLADDNSTGRILHGTAEIIPFKGIERRQNLAYGPFSQDSTVEGVLLRVGGKDTTAHALVEVGDNTTVSCVVSRDLARELAPHLYGPTLRFRGAGRYERSWDGGWIQRTFRAGSFEVLENRRLLSIIADLRAVSGNGWKGVEEPLVELDAIRADEDTDS